MFLSERIILDPKILTGKPVIKGTRLAVEFILELMGQGWSEEQLFTEYPGLEHADILACLSYACESVRAERVYPVGVGA